MADLPQHPEPVPTPHRLLVLCDCGHGCQACDSTGSVELEEEERPSRAARFAEDDVQFWRDHGIGEGRTDG